ncbi:MAG: ornithine carbamoyltransferase [Actinobacteria bacterium]|nr:ornithine carbamoyltransferase [Actinomycetota bacterium]
MHDLKIDLETDKSIIKKKKDFLTLKDYSKEEIQYLLSLSSEMKKNGSLYDGKLKGKNIAMLFEKHSTRTRLSFEVAISQLGGNCIYLDVSSLQIKRGETIEDSAKIFEMYLDGLVIRTFEHQKAQTFAGCSNISVINGLTDLYHPCQALSDLFTISELGLLDKDLKFTWLGDCNNVSNSLMIGFAKLGIDISLGCSPEYVPSRDMLEYVMGISEKSGSRIKLIHDPVEAVSGADIIYTDVWISMGDKDSEEKIRKLQPFQINKKLLKYARPEARVMHCLPAHREQEITSEVLDSKHSIVWQQAENRLYAQKALLVYLFSENM